jgi:putative ABC transport system permease protein
VDAELQREIEIHIQQLTNAALAEGLTEAEARAAAWREFGPIEQTKEQCRETRRVGWIQDLVQDVRYGLRMLRESPGFTSIAVLTLAVGIGANTAIFSILDAVLLRSLPYVDPDQLVLLLDVPVKRPDVPLGVSYRDCRECRAQNQVFSEMTENAFHDLTLTGAGEPFVVNTGAVTPELFRLLNAKPLTGRALMPDDGKQGATPVAVLSENLWRTRFGSNPHLVGQSIAFDMRAFTVVGVLPASFRYPDGAPHQDVWISVLQDPLFGPLTSQPRVRLLGVLGRLKPGTSLVKAQAEMDILSARLAKEFPTQDAGVTIRVEPYQKAVVGSVRFPLLILLGAVAIVLLMACANLANLLLSRTTPRGREIAVRRALGASRTRLVRQLLTESALLGLLGGVAGVLLGASAVWGFQPWLSADLVQISSIHIEGPVLVFALFLSFASALAFALAPALLATSTNLQANLKEGGARSGHRRGQHVRASWRSSRRHWPWCFWLGVAC